MGNGLVIRTDIEVGKLRRHARLEADGRVAARLNLDVRPDIESCHRRPLLKRGNQRSSDLGIPDLPLL